MHDSLDFFVRTEAVFHAALRVPREMREATLRAECSGNEVLMAEVRSLLAAAEDEERVTAAHRTGSMNGITGGMLSGLAERTIAPGSSSGGAAKVERRIGPYAVERLLGRGGMGAVYLAHRADGQFEQDVAIKLIDLPLATDLFRNRFRMERQILAGLVHPYIARLLDGGVTDNGDLYLVMEYVDGLSITRYCEQKQASVRERLRLFLAVCEAVQFAHQNLVVHRDLKPDNILVLADGTPRLLDFGTAKILSPSGPGGGAGPENELTRMGFHSFTPQYASPEQVLGNPITTASDTYSLGVLLYQLLACRVPYSLKEFSTAEMVRVICNEEPARPSTVAPAERKLDADLDAIVMKALRKEPKDRYLTAEQFAGDVRAWLDGRPVEARGGAFRYRAGKFARRNRLALAAAGLLFASLTAGLAGVLWQAHVANVERRKAEARSADLRELSDSLLSELNEAIQQLPGSTGAQHLLVTRVLEHLDRMARDSDGDRDTQLELVDAYTRLGNIQGVPYAQNLGDKAGALASLKKAIDMADPLAAAHPGDKAVLRALAVAQDLRGEVLGETEDIQGAVRSLRASAETYNRLVALPGATPALILEAATATSTLGDVLGQDTGLADTSAALAAYQQSLALDERALQLDPNLLRTRTGIANMHMKIGNAELDIDPAEALIEFRLALKLTDELPAAEQDTVNTLRLRGITLRKIANALSELGEYDQAEPLYRQAIGIHQKLADADAKDVRSPSDVRRALQTEAENYEYAADPVLARPSRDSATDEAADAEADEAASRRKNLAALEGVLEQYRANLQASLKRVPGNPDRQAELANVEVRLGSVRQLLGKGGDSVAMVRSGLAMLKTAAAREHASPMVLDMVATAWLAAQPASLRDPKFTLAIAERGTAMTHRKAPAWMLTLVEAYRAAGQPEKARAAAEEGLALLPRTAPGQPKSRLRRLFELAAAGGSGR
jgi:tetratricopeptide (TPR) repeat protein